PVQERPESVRLLLGQRDAAGAQKPRWLPQAARHRARLRPEKVRPQPPVFGLPLSRRAALLPRADARGGQVLRCREHQLLQQLDARKAVGGRLGAHVGQALYRDRMVREGRRRARPGQHRRRGLGRENPGRPRQLLPEFHAGLARIEELHRLALV
nr:hypothetical protein [Tanacetum cinerariifolium]